ncbi:hypothetical protein Tco_0796467 [Tanacetum coccineum]
MLEDYLVQFSQVNGNGWCNTAHIIYLVTSGGGLPVVRVRGNIVAAYTQRFQELALMCTKFLANETEKVDKYISGLPDNIPGNVMSARPKTLSDAIEFGPTT